MRMTVQGQRRFFLDTQTHYIIQSHLPVRELPREWALAAWPQHHHDDDDKFMAHRSQRMHTIKSRTLNIPLDWVGGNRSLSRRRAWLGQRPADLMKS
jgi:hypothetical protein